MIDTPWAPRAADDLRAAGLRVTRSREAVYEALRDRPHASADDIHTLVMKRMPHTSLQSVYNALGDFVTADLARRIEPAGRPMLFELHLRDNHHHAVCTSCGAVADVECATGAAPCLHPADPHGFSIQEAEITFWGLCADCAASDPTIPTPPPHMEGKP
ncbi:Fur family transcriptional regulator [Microbacterium sp. P01]|uniref:Fur family transcriptional regulator n=1 Tax=unclassified Microbacterium TaxID=2609290 RepID=UPI00367348AB